MNDETLAERIVRLETQILGISKDLEAKAKHETVATIQKSLDARSTREWTIIMTGIGLILAIISKAMGWGQ
jgi:hypothetical protein